MNNRLSVVYATNHSSQNIYWPCTPGSTQEKIHSNAPNVVKLTKHSIVHTGVKPFQCDICDKTCSRKSNLNVHMRIHLLDKPYKCTVCGRGFAQNGELSRHLRTHTGEKPYKCVVCSKKFAHQSGLKYHMKVLCGQYLPLKWWHLTLEYSWCGERVP